MQVYISHARADAKLADRKDPDTDDAGLQQIAQALKAAA